MGDAVPISPMDWGVVAEHHKELFGAKNRDVTSLWCKFNSITNMTPPTGDPKIPGYILVAKNMMWAIEIKMDSGEIGRGDLGIERMNGVWRGHSGWRWQ
jgi:hypothetical protein